MADKEKVIKGLECCTSFDSVDQTCMACPFENDCVGKQRNTQLLHDALALLKEQEAEIEHMKRPDCEHAEHDSIGCLGYCGCAQDDEPIESCKRCEKYTGNVYEAVKWDE